MGAGVGLVAPLCVIEAETLARAAVALFGGEFLLRGVLAATAVVDGGRRGGGGPVLAGGGGSLTALPSAGGERGPQRLGAAQVVVQAFEPIDVLVQGLARWGDLAANSVEWRGGEAPLQSVPARLVTVFEDAAGREKSAY